MTNDVWNRLQNLGLQQATLRSRRSALKSLENSQFSDQFAGLLKSINEFNQENAFEDGERKTALEVKIL